MASAVGAGSIIAALWSGRLIARVGEQRLAIAGLLNFAAGNLLRASGWLPAAVLGSVVLGFALPWVFLATLNMAQRTTPISLQERVSAAITLALFGPQAPTQAFGALAITHATYTQICRVGDGKHRDRCLARFPTNLVPTHRRRSALESVAVEPRACVLSGVELPLRPLRRPSAGWTDRSRARSSRCRPRR